jgi:GNAT superfamily N-acetyltransferase
MRICRVSDRNPVLDELDRACFPVDPPYKKEGAHWWVVRGSAKTFAFAGLRDVGWATAFLCRVGVLKGYRGQGLQKRLIRVRIAAARRMGFRYIVTYTSPDNMASANSLIATGFRLYNPANPYGMAGAFYFYLEL